MLTGLVELCTGGFLPVLAIGVFSAGSSVGDGLSVNMAMVSRGKPNNLGDLLECLRRKQWPQCAQF